MTQQDFLIPDQFTDGAIAGLLVEKLPRHRDDRGWLLELYRHDEVDASTAPEMAYVSETLPGVTRGPHAHLEQTDRFVVLGPARFSLYFWDIRQASSSWGRHVCMESSRSEPLRILVPPGVVHAYRNMDDVPGLIFNAPNRLYRGQGRTEQVDEIRYEDRADHPFQM